MSDKDDKTGKNPGGVRHDSRGNAVWQWAVDSGKQALDSTSRLLKRLEVPGLKLEGDTTENRQPGAPGQDSGAGGGKSGAGAKPDREAGYNPYGAARPAASKPPPTKPLVVKPSATKPPATQPGAARPTAATKPAAGIPSRPSLWQRLFRKR